MWLLWYHVTHSSIEDMIHDLSSVIVYMSRMIGKGNGSIYHNTICTNADKKQKL